MTMATVFETQERLGQRAPIGERRECPREGKRCSPAPATWTVNLGGHGAARAAGSQLDQAHFAAVAEASTLGHEGIAASAAGWPEDGENAIKKHTKIVGAGSGKVACLASFLGTADSAWRCARGQGTLASV